MALPIYTTVPYALLLALQCFDLVRLRTTIPVLCPCILHVLYPHCTTSVMSDYDHKAVTCSSSYTTYRLLVREWDSLVIYWPGQARGLVVLNKGKLQAADQVYSYKVLPTTHTHTFLLPVLCPCIQRVNWLVSTLCHWTETEISYMSCLPTRHFLHISCRA